jgi:hypothetical protein
MIPKPTVMRENITLGPSILTRIVAGIWKATLATVYTRMETDCHIHQLPIASSITYRELTYRFPTPNPRSSKMLATLALEIIPLQNSQSALHCETGSWKVQTYRADSMSRALQR